MIVSLMVYSTPSMPLVTYCSILVYTATDKPLIPGLNRFEPGISNSTVDVSMHWYSACARGPSMCELLEKNRETSETTLVLVALLALL